MVPPLSQAGAILRTGAAESLWGDMRRNGLQPENLLTWLSLFGALLGTLGITCYVITWFGYQQFYRSFNVSPETVGISYPALLIPAAVFFSLIVMVLAGLAGLVAPLFMRLPTRSARIQWRVGLLIFLAASFSGAVMGPPPQTGLPAGRVILVLSLLFGGVLFAYGIAVILLDKYDRPLRYVSSVRRLHRQIQPKHSLEERADMGEYVATRRRQRRNRAQRRKDMRGAAPVTLILLLPVAVLLMLSFVIYLAHSAEHAASAVVAGKPAFESAGDFPAGVLLNVKLGRWTCWPSSRSSVRLSDRSYSISVRRMGRTYFTTLGRRRRCLSLRVPSHCNSAKFAIRTLGRGALDSYADQGVGEGLGSPLDNLAGR